MNFHATHFSAVSIDHFSQHFLGPYEAQDYCREQDQEDDLGYYEDGAKRTLTNEQIAMFRHSEIQTLLRERRHKRQAEISNSPELSIGIGDDDVEEGEAEDEEGRQEIGTYTQPTPTPKSTRQSKKKRRKKSQHNSTRLKHPAKPDLRKRTWDKVEEGLGRLDYDEITPDTDPSEQPRAQRRRVSYNDD